MIESRSFESSAAFEPDWVSAPGETIADALDELGMSQADLALRTGFTKKHVNGMVKGGVAITADAALRLEAVLGEPASFWLQREAQYREAVARRELSNEAATQKSWLRELPVAWMVAQGWLKKATKKEQQVVECLRFFGVASVAAWSRVHEEPLVAFRSSKRFQRKHGSVAAWLREAELRAADVDCAPFDRSAFVSALPELRSLTLESDLEVLMPSLQEACRALGVALVFLPCPPGCPVHAATRWLAPDKALLVLSLRYKTDDQLWFSFFHEVGHILKHGKRLLFVEGADTEQHELEHEADRFARDLLIPPPDAKALAALRTHAEVTSFADELGLPPGILVGRMQWEGWIPHRNLNRLKVRYVW